MRSVLLAVAAGALVGSSSGGGGSAVEVSRSDFGNEWPLTVDSGTLDCDEPGLVTFSANGTTYAVNGLAIGSDRWPDIDAIWADDPQQPGLKISIGPLIDRGLAICEAKT
jgi:hypothetical protein